MKARIRKRRLAFVAVVASLVLFTFAAGTFAFPFGHNHEYSRWQCGQGVFYYLDVPFPSDLAYGWEYLADESVMPATWNEWNEELGKGFIFESDYWQVPILTPSLFTLTVASVFIWRPLRLPKPGSCVTCGYDLKGNGT